MGVICGDTSVIIRKIICFSVRKGTGTRLGKLAPLIIAGPAKKQR